MDNKFKEFVQSHRVDIIKTMQGSKTFSSRDEINELYYDAAEAIVNLLIGKIGTDTYANYKYGMTDFYLEVIKNEVAGISLDKEFLSKYDTLLSVPCQSNERAVTILQHFLSNEAVVKYGGFYPALAALSVVIREEWGVFVVPENLMADYQYNFIILMTCKDCYVRNQSASWIAKNCFIPYRR